MPIFKVDVTLNSHQPRVVDSAGAPVRPVNDFLIYLEQCARSPYTVRAYAGGLRSAAVQPVMRLQSTAPERVTAVKREPSTTDSACSRPTSRFEFGRMMKAATARGAASRTRYPRRMRARCLIGWPGVINPCANGGENFVAVCLDGFRLVSIRF